MAADPERLLDLVEEAGIVTPVEGGYVLTDAFADAQADATTRLETESADTIVPEVAEVDRDALLDPERPPELAAVLAVRELAEADWAEAVAIASALARFAGPGARDDLPPVFVPLEETEVEGFLRANPRSVVVFWADDSPACATVLVDLASLADEGALDDVALGAVYTPEATAYSRETYQVNVVPTTLFCVGERVDSRLIGAFPPRAFLAEVETIRELA